MSHKRSLLPAISAVVLVLLCGITIQSLAKVQPVPLLQGLEKFPLRLGLWQGNPIPLDQNMISSLHADGTLYVEYTSPEKGPVSLWVAYYSNVPMAGGIHSPMLCLTSSGWHLQESGVVEVIPGKSVKYMVMHEQGQDVLVNYWYIQANRWLTNLYYYKFNMIFDKLWHRRSDAALVRIITPLQPDKDMAQARLKEFVGLIGPVLPEFIAD
jgi:EpsI family protein